MVVHCCNSSYIGGVGPGKKHKTLFEKQTKAERAGSVTQVVEHLPSKQDPEFKLQYCHKEKEVSIEKQY
jgi:hypothetical protein